MDRVIQRYESLTEADSADVEYYASLTPEERLDILFALVESYRNDLDEASERFERVYRIDELSRS